MRPLAYSQFDNSILLVSIYASMKEPKSSQKTLKSS